MRTLTTAAVLFALALPASLAAQDRDQRGGFEIAPFIGVWDDRPEFGPEDRPAFVDPAGNISFGAHLGYHWAGGFFVETEFGFFPVQLINAGETDAFPADRTMIDASLGYDIPLSNALDLFLSAGGGLARTSSDFADSDSDVAFKLGSGLRWMLSNNFGLRFDADYAFVPNSLEEQFAGAGEAFPGETLNSLQLQAGFAIRLGGGPGDDDNDGVTNDIDQCPDTPRGATVDARGCAVDSDMDGVADYMDDCPDTPRGATVDARGCPTDSDNDGVFDGIDQCPNTPAGAEVNARGCPMDSDNDGVFNGIDECPNTRRGATVDARGCEIVQEEPEPEPITVENVLFDFDSDMLDDADRAILDRAGRQIEERGNVRIDIGGHADAIGSGEYNDDLSRRRAERVVNYLVENFDIPRSAFSVQYFGEDRPVATNDTADGRRLNRRVEITVNQ